MEELREDLAGMIDGIDKLRHDLPEMSPTVGEL